jgi:HEAT repeat protein
MYPGPERDRVINILSSAACKESQFLCRAAAIEALGNYRDPRVVPGLTKAFYSASTFPGDLAARLQMQALAALGETREPSAEEFLLVVVKDRSKVEGSEQEKQLVLDVRLAAARSLGNFQSDRSEATLTDLIRTERDVAMRDTARLALKHSRGEDSPWDIQAIAGMFLPSTPREKEEAAIVGEPLPSNTQPVQRAGFVQSPQR